MSPTPDPAASPAREAELVFPAIGEMGRLCREMSWGATPLGPVENWPQSLKTAAGMVVAQGIAQNLCWGPDLLQIYNDAYRVIMGDKHPAGLGRSVLWSWSEIRGEIEPLFERVFRGETLYFEDLRLRVQRRGALEDAYFTFSYSPVRVESGEVGAVLINVFETTQQVHARALQAERDRLLSELQVERERLFFIFQHAPSFLAVIRGREHVFELVNDAYYQLVGHRDVVGRRVSDAIPEVEAQGFIALLDRVLETGEPFLGLEVPIQLARLPGDALEERFVDLSFIPLVEADGTRSGVIAHGTDQTEQVLARREVEHLLTESERARGEAEAARTEADVARRHLERVIAQAPVAMYIATGREHVFQVVNEAYYAMVGKRPEEVLGRPAREVFPELVEQGVFDIIEAVYDSGVAFTAPAIRAAFDADGDDVPEDHYFNLVYQPLRDGRGAVYAIALVATEVTELVQAREAAEAAQREAEQANRAKAEFLASMSHELRTPLNAIAGYVDLVDMGVHGPVSPEQKQALARVSANQRHLLTLINDILAYAKLEAGQMEFELRPLSSLELISSVEPLVAPLAQAKGIDLSVRACDPSHRLIGDEERVRQILLNLVGNAIKFTPEGGWIRLSCERSAGWVEIRVSDNGPGIPADKQHKIFDPFVQVDRRLSSPQEGVGLGLAISRDLARGMSGELSVCSEPDQGSVFALRLPAEEAPREGGR